MMNKSAIILVLLGLLASFAHGQNERMRLTNTIDSRHLQVTSTNALSKATTINTRVVWVLINLGDDTFNLKNEVTGGILEANSLSDNVRVNFNSPIVPNDRQRWRFVGNTLVNVGLSKCLDVNNEVIITKTCNGFASQNWARVLL